MLSLSDFIREASGCAKEISGIKPCWYVGKTKKNQHIIYKYSYLL